MKKLKIRSALLTISTTIALGTSFVNANDHLRQPTISFSSSVKTPDQILNAMERRIYVPTAKKNQIYKVVFSFKSGEYVLDELLVEGIKDEYIQLDISDFEELAKQYQGQVAYINLIDKNDKKLFKKSSRPKLYITSGNIDYKCENPVLIADMNGTLDLGDQCTVDSLNKINKKHELPIFIVSSLGLGAEPALKRIGLDDERNLLVLENANDFLGLGGSYMGGGAEKAYRVFRQIVGAGVCAIGFAGDSLTSDGKSTEILDRIPFFPVNIPDTQISNQIDTEYEEEVCIVKENIKKIIEIEDESDCNAPYEIKKHKVTVHGLALITGEVCQKMRTQRKQHQDTGIAGSYTVNVKVGSPVVKKSCDSKSFFEGRDVFYKKIGLTYDDGSFSEVSRWGGNVRRYHIKKTCEIKEQITPNLISLMNKCDHSELYDFKVLKKIKTHYEYTSKPKVLDMSIYPKGSIQQKNWCELEKTITNRLEKLKNI